MRLSAAKVTVGPSKLGRTALGANLRGGALALSVGEAQMYGGIAKGSFGIARSDAVADIKAQFQFTDVDLQACAGELFGIKQTVRPRQSQRLADGFGRAARLASRNRSTAPRR